jgi:hypothetical protein
MTRLSTEIGALHNALDDFIGALKYGVAEMQVDFNNARTEMANNAKAERVEFVSDIQKSVIDLKKTVAGMRQEFIDDIEGARRAWAGRGA